MGVYITRLPGGLEPPTLWLSPTELRQPVFRSRDYLVILRVFHEIRYNYTAILQRNPEIPYNYVYHFANVRKMVSRADLVISHDFHEITPGSTYINRPRGSQAFGAARRQVIKVGL